jgi:Raf kinase inhibitor-like YbhB/YbcL family protein
MKHWMPIRWRSRSRVLLLVVGALLASGCEASSAHMPTLPASPATSPTTEVAKTIVLTSSAFREGHAIPSLYTCAGASTSPPLAWSHVPSNTTSFVLIMEDVSGGGDFTHWVLFNVPPDTRGLPANIPHGGQLATGARQGLNDADEVGYLGPCPDLPKGATDYYLFTLYSLDTTLNVAGGASKQDVLAAASGHMLAIGQLEGSYKLPPPPTATPIGQ